MCVCKVPTLWIDLFVALEQQALLRDAMRRLNLTRDAFSARLSVKRRTLDSWLLPTPSADARTMPDAVRLLIEHVLQEAGLAAATIDPAAHPGFGGDRICCRCPSSIARDLSGCSASPT